MQRFYDHLRDLTINRTELCHETVTKIYYTPLIWAQFGIRGYEQNPYELANGHFGNDIDAGHFPDAAAR